MNWEEKQRKHLLYGMTFLPKTPCKRTIPCVCEKCRFVPLDKRKGCPKMKGLDVELYEQYYGRVKWLYTVERKRHV